MLFACVESIPVKGDFFPSLPSWLQQSAENSTVFVRSGTPETFVGGPHQRLADRCCV